MRPRHIIAASILPLLAGCSTATDESTDTLSAEASTSSMATTTLDTVPNDCTPASAEDIAKIEATLTNGANRLDETHVLQGAKFRMVTANIYGGDERLSSLDSWVLWENGITALSSSAQEYSNVADFDELILDEQLVVDDLGDFPHSLTASFLGCV